MGIMRRRMRRRVVVAGAATAGAAYAVGKHRGQDQAGEEAPAEYESEPQYVPPAPSAPVADSGPADELERLAKLHADGILSDDEFAQAKARVLGA